MSDTQHLNCEQVVSILKGFGYPDSKILSKVNYEEFVGAEISSSKTLEAALQKVADSNSQNNKLILFKVSSETRSFDVDLARNNHYVALHFRKTDDDLEITYIDPTGAEPSQIIKNLVEQKFNETDLSHFKPSLQYTDSTNENGTFIMGGNDYDCGPLVGLAADIARLDPRLSRESFLKLNEDESKKLGQVVRKLGRINNRYDVVEEIKDIFQNHYTRLESPTTKEVAESKFKTPISKVTDKIKLKNSELTNESYESDVGNEGIKLDGRKINSSRENQLKKYVKSGTMGSALRDAAHTYPLITQDKKGYKVSESKIKSGYDEMFDTARAKKWNKLDDKLHLNLNKNNPTFKEAFAHFRGRTKDLRSYEDGHVGSMFKKKPTNASANASSGGYFAGRSENEGYGHDKRRIINKVLKEAKKGDRAAEKRSPVKAATEIIKLIIDKVVGYRKNTDENDNKFGGWTSSGMKLSNQIDRDFALKSSQAYRDRNKLAVVSLEGRWNDIDSENGDDKTSKRYFTDDEKKLLIKQKVSRTKNIRAFLKEDSSSDESENSSESSGSDAEDSISSNESKLSSIRSGSPFSEFVFNRYFEKLEIASKEKEGKELIFEIAKIVAEPTPELVPDKKLKKSIQQELDKEKKEAVSDSKNSDIDRLIPAKVESPSSSPMKPKSKKQIEVTQAKSDKKQQHK